MNRHIIVLENEDPASELRWDADRFTPFGGECALKKCCKKYKKKGRFCKNCPKR